MNGGLSQKKTGGRLKRILLLAWTAGFVFLLANQPFLAERFFARGLSRLLGGLLGAASGALPFSLYEWTAAALLIGGTFACGALIGMAAARDGARAGRWIYRLGVFALSALIAFGVLYAPLYRRPSPLRALGLKETAVTEEKVYAAAEYYLEELNVLAARVERDGSGAAVCPHSFSRLADLANAAFDGLDAGGYFSPFRVRPKRVALSDAMGYLGITGIYFPFYGEANVNADIPDCDLAVTLFHETAHAKGVSQEGDANSVAYVLCVRSQDEYLRYSGLLAAFSALFYDLPKESRDLLRERMAIEVAREYELSSAYYAAYDGPVDAISSFFNDLFLKSNGVAEGARSYGATAECLVSLYESFL